VISKHVLLALFREANGKEQHMRLHAKNSTGLALRHRRRADFTTHLLINNWKESEKSMDNSGTDSGWL